MNGWNCFTTRKWFRWSTAAAFLLAAPHLYGYEGRLHQELTFIAAKAFNECVAETDIPRLSPLQVRYMARTNVQLAERSGFVRIFNWRYYDRGSQEDQSLLWVIDTRFHDHFNEIQRRLQDAEYSGERYRDLGRIVSYIQLVSSPPHTVPVYTARFWRFSVSDRFDRFPVDVDAVQERLNDACDELFGQDDSYADILRRVADDTLVAVRSPIQGLPASWQAFWTLSKEPHSFGEYGPAGNSFGRNVEFPCEDGQRCVLLKGDPLYGQFASDRHAAAVRGTMAAMLVLQRSIAANGLARALQ